MKFRTEIKVPALNRQIDYGSPVLMLGSCFTGLIGNKLHQLLFDVTINPFGVIYNPFSIKSSLKKLLEKSVYAESDLQQHGELWLSFDHYTKFSGTDLQQTLEAINREFLTAREKMKKNRFLILTFGTAFVYEHLATGNIVSNCHKIPANEFRRYRLSVKEIVDEYTAFIPKLLELQPDLHILFTVSPVRHLKDGFAENQRSKATLLLSIEALLDVFPGSCSYFPSYEVMMDDLRDYRYYDDDLLHPGTAAVNYIWERFSEAAITPDSRKIAFSIAELLKAAAHKPLHSGTQAYQQFRSATLGKMRKLRDQFPFLQWENFPEF